jgi:hypothetical protein
VQEASSSYEQRHYVGLSLPLQVWYSVTIQGYRVSNPLPVKLHPARFFLIKLLDTEYRVFHMAANRSVRRCPNSGIASMSDFDPVLCMHSSTDASNLLSSRPQTRDIDNKTSAT